MKTHENYSLLGGLKMAKITSKRKNIKSHPTTTPVFKEDAKQPDQEEAQDVYGDSVMQSTQIVRLEELH